MDAQHFDALARHLGSRRIALGGLLAGVLAPLEAVARGKNNRVRKGRGKDRDRGKEKGKDKKKSKGNGQGKDQKRANAQGEPCWRAGACILKKGANVSRCNLAGYTSTTPLDCTGCNISRANLRGANLSGANLTRANLSGSCLVNATLSGATIANNTNLANAVFCNTVMPDGSINNSGCGNGTTCCDTCLPSTCAQTCCSGQCVNVQTNPNNCGACGRTCEAGDICLNGACACGADTCQSLGKQCGSWPDGCGGTLDCGSCTPPLQCGDGVCRACDVCASGCAFTSVQAAVDAATAGDTILICAGTYPTAATITKDLTLIGAGAGTNPSAGTILDGEQRNNVLFIREGTVTLRTMTITRGGFTFDGAGILNRGTLFVEGVDILNNRATYAGGGIHNEGALTVRGNSRIEENFAGYGGGGLSNLSTITLEDCSIARNTSEGRGGGLWNYDVSPDINSQAIVKAGTDIRRNQAPSGGGLYSSENSVITLEAGSVITLNTATDGAGAGGGVYEVPNSTVTVANSSIVTGNTSDNCAPVGAVPNCVG